MRAVDSSHNTAAAVPKSPRADKLYRFSANRDNFVFLIEKDF